MCRLTHNYFFFLNISMKFLPVTISAIRISAKTAPINPKTGEINSKNDPIAANGARTSMLCLRVSECSVMSAVPSFEGFVNPGVWVFRGLLAGKFLLHTFHPRAE